MENEMIRLEGIKKKYRKGTGEVLALDGVSLSISKGGFTAITGRSGSGKSTLMNIMGCLDTADSGRYFLCGEDVSSFRDSELCAMRRKKIGFVFQSFNLLPEMSAAENVELPLIYAGMPKKQRRECVGAALEAVGLSERSDHKPKELSGGQQQRVAIARAVAAEPDIILADEPTGSLDKASGGEVIRLLRDMNRRGVTVVLITHDEEIARSADRRIVISDGRVVEG